LDAAVGRVSDRIDELGLTEHTIVIVLSDNGAFMIPGRGLECASNRPLKGGGTTLWEGGIRVPCVVRWPGRIKPGMVCSEPLWSIDLVPMALHAASLKLPSDRTFDGKDPMAALAGQGASPHPYLCWRWGSTSAAIRVGQYKLIRERRARTGDWQMFDLERDVGETNNLLAARPDLARRLESQLARWEEDATAGR
jgi:arylsulfatase A-like enzyme